jgi:hypothetical protein
MTLQRWIVVAAVAFVSVVIVTTVASYALWSSGGEAPPNHGQGERVEMPR